MEDKDIDISMYHRTDLSSNPLEIKILVDAKLPISFSRQLREFIKRVMSAEVR